MKKKTDFPFLVAQSGPLSGNRWIINDKLMIGRETDCDVVIPDRQVSRYHAKVFLKSDESVELHDMGSKNGTFINGERVTDFMTIKDGDQIKIALIQDFTFVSSDATVPLLMNEKALLKEAGRLLIDEHARRVWVNEMEIIPPLSVQQFRLLRCLYVNRGEVVPREKIVQDVWELTKSSGVTEQALDALVRRLRDRLNEYDNIHNYLVTVRGFGIRFDNPDYE